MKKFLLSIALMAVATMGWALNVECTPGNLSSLVNNPGNIEELTVTGQMDARDFKFIYDELDKLKRVDLSGVTIVAYSNPVPLLNNEVNYPARCIPPLAFFGKRLTQVSLPADIRAIGKAAFAGCDQLATFVFPEGLDSIGAYAFSATKLSSIVLPATLKSLDEGAFSRMPNLTSVTINPAVPMEIPISAFEGCLNLENVNLGPNVKGIGDRAFKGTTKLSQIQFTVQNNITRIGEEAFVGSNLNNFDFENSLFLTSVSDWAFAQSKQITAVIPASVNHMGKGVFYYATNLTSFVPDAHCDTISDLLLAGTKVVNDVTAATNVSYIGRYAFYNTPITSLTLPSTVNYIGDRAMAGMTKLHELTSEATEVPELGEDVWIGVNQSKIPLYVPLNGHEAYLSAPQWCLFDIRWNEIFGDVNQDGFVTAADITAIYDILLGNSMDYYETADVNGDGSVTAADITAVYNVLLGNSKAPGRNQVVSDINDLMSAQGFIIEGGKTHDMSVDISSSEAFSAMQLDLIMPQGLSIENVSSTDLTRGMTIGYNEIEPGKWRVLFHNFTPTNGNEGSLLVITVRADDSFSGNEIIGINNIIAVEPSERVHLFDELDVEVGTVTGVTDIDNNILTGPVDVYNMNGQLLRKGVSRDQATNGLPQGVYIVGGKKVIVR